MSHRCPDDMTLAALFEGRLSPDAKEALYGEMSGCPQCQETLALVGLGLADETAAGEELFPGEIWSAAKAPAVPPTLEAKVRALYADVGAPAEPVWRVAVRRVRGAFEALADSLAPAPMPALAVRGAGERDGLRFELDVGVPVELVLMDGGAAGTQVAIRPLGTPMPRSRVVLARGDAIEASLALEPEGVRLPGLSAGRYVLRFEVPGRAVTELPLDLVD